MSDSTGEPTGAAGGGPGGGGHTPLVTSVPAELKTLIRIIMRTFYGFELYLCMDMLLVYPCIKVEDLAELLRLELKQVHQHLVNLKKDKFVNERAIMETSGDGKPKSYSYYYINYKMMVNVVKYKLDRIRTQIETEEKQSTTRAVFRCSECKKSFSDLETKEIFFTMRCDHCGGDVEEDVSALPSRSSGNLLAKLNTQLQIVFTLLQKVEHVRLADDIMRPEPMDMLPILEKITSSSGSGASAGSNGSAGDRAGGSSSASGPGGRKYDGMNGIKWSDRTSKQDLAAQTRIMVNFDTPDAKSAGSRPQKELPSLILANQTTDESINTMDTTSASNTSSRDSLLLNNIKKAANDTLNNSTSIYGGGVKPAAAANSTSLNDSASAKAGAKGAQSSSTMPAPTGTSLETLILQKLLIHEKKAGGGAGDNTDNTGDKPEPPPPPFNRTSSFIAISTKRDFETTLLTNRSENNLSAAATSTTTSSGSSATTNEELRDPIAFKRRRLNNGGALGDYSKTALNNSRIYGHLATRRSCNDGSDRELDEDMTVPGGSGYDDDQTTSSSMASSSAESSWPVAMESSNSGDDLMPLVTVQAKRVRLDRVTPEHINAMSVTEKDYYINLCRQLYMELYEI